MYTRPPLNRKLLQELADHLLGPAMKDKSLPMSSWMTRETYLNGTERAKVVIHQCGYAGCAIGEASFLPGFIEAGLRRCRDRMQQLWFQSQKDDPLDRLLYELPAGFVDENRSTDFVVELMWVLGLEHDEITHLFIAESYPPIYETQCWIIPAEVVGKRIVEFLESKEEANAATAANPE